MVDALAGYFARTVGEPWADYFDRTVEEQPSSANALVDYFDKVVGFLALHSLGTIAAEHKVRSETIAAGQSVVDYLAKAGMYWGMAHWICQV